MLLAFIVAAVIALILNPMVPFLQRRRLPRGAGDPRSSTSALLRRCSAASACCWPTRSPTRRRSSATTCRGIVDDANERLADLQDYFDRKGINVEVKRQGETALQTLQEKVVGGTSDIVDFGGQILKTVVTAGLGLLLVIVLSVYMLIYGERIGALVRVGDAAGRRHAEPTTSRPGSSARSRGYVRGQLLFSLAMGTGAGLGAVRLRRHRGLPGRQDLRLRVRRVVRPDGARPVRRAVPRRAAAAARRALPGPADGGLARDLLHRAAAARGPRRRAATSSATRCGSTRCW